MPKICLCQEMNSQDISKAKVIAKNSTDSIVGNWINEYNRKLVSELKKIDELSTFEFVGGGDLSTLKNSADNETNGGISLGLYALRSYKLGRTSLLKDIEIDFALNVAATVDTVMQINGTEFGSYILQPVNNRFSARLDFTTFFKNDVRNKKKKVRHAVLDLVIIKQKKQRAFEKAKKNRQLTKKRISTIEKQIEQAVSVENKAAIRQKLLTQQNALDSLVQLVLVTKDSFTMSKIDIRDAKQKAKQKYDLLDVDNYTAFNKIVEGGYLKLYGDRSQWTRDSLKTKAATVIHLRTGVFHELLPNDVARENDISAKLGIGYSLRQVLGDISQRIDKNMPETHLSEYIGTDKKTYHGIDFFFGLQFNRIKAEFIIPKVFSGDVEIPGFTNTQFLVNVRFVGGFPLQVKKQQVPSVNDRMGGS